MTTRPHAGQSVELRDRTELALAVSHGDQARYLGPDNDVVGYDTIEAACVDDFVAVMTTPGTQASDYVLSRRFTGLRASSHAPEIGGREGSKSLTSVT